MSANLKPHELTTKTGAVVLREMLRDAFPTSRFSVRTQYYAGGSSIRVHYENGPPGYRVEEIAERLQGRGFDGMTDCSYSNGRTFKHRGQDYAAPHCYVSVSRNTDPGAKMHAAAFLERTWADWSTIPQYERDRRIQCLVSCCWVDAGGTLRPPTEVERGEVTLAELSTRGHRALEMVESRRQARQFAIDNGEPVATPRDEGAWTQGAP